jgi:M6 family metalloprotease-like protein
MPTTGARKTFALLIEFQDAQHQNSPQAINNALYGRPGPGAPYESVAAYYDRASYHRLDLFGGATLGWYQTPYPRANVNQTDAGRDELVKEALKYFNAQGHDFSQYDTDKDGVVDFFYVIWAGKDDGWGTFWWPYQTVVDDPSFTLNGVGFWRFAWMWESRPLGAPFDAATPIHETGHVLGLPDYYDYDPQKGAPGGVGGLDMMDSAKYDHNCFSKWMLDWSAPTVITGGSRVLTLRPSGSSDDCVMLWYAAQAPDLFGQFFMVQNRQQVGNDVSIPGTGLVIWHVDARISKGDFTHDNSFTPHKLIRLMEADGLEQIQARKLADAGDFYQPGSSFGPATVPSSVAYSRKPSGVEVKDIQNQVNGLSAKFAVIAQAAPVPA